MGPRLFSRGNSVKDYIKMRREEQLQWGHDFSAVEIVKIGRTFKFAILASMGPRLFSRGNGGHFSASVDIEKLAVFEMFFNSRGVFCKVRLSSREFSLFGGVSSAPRSSRNHITSRKASRY